MRSTVTKDRRNRRLIVERTLSAPPATLWAAWTQPDRIAMWWGPAGWVVEIVMMDVRPGGVWHYRLHPVDAAESMDAAGSTDAADRDVWGRAVYRTVEPPTLLEYIDGFSDASGAVVDGSEMPTTVTFTAAGDRTLLAIVTTFGTVEQLDGAEAMGMVSGFDEALERLSHLIASASGTSRSSSESSPTKSRTKNTNEDGGIRS